MNVLLGNSVSPSIRDYFNVQATGGEISILPASIGVFTSSEAFSEIGNEEHAIKPRDIKGQPVTIIQSLMDGGGRNANDLAMQLLLTVKTLKRNGAGPVWVIMPFMAYGRQDRPFDGRMTSVAIDDFSSLLKHAGAEGISTVEMHSPAALNLAINHFGKKNVFNLDPTELFATDIENNIDTTRIVVGGPDSGANIRADALAKRLGVSKFEFEKKHTGVNETEITAFLGDVDDKYSVTVDDMIDGGSTIINAQSYLFNAGTKKRYVYTSLPIMSKGALEKLFTAKAADRRSRAITQLVLLDTIDIENLLVKLKRQYGAKAVNRRIRQLSCGEMLYDHVCNDIINHPSMKMKLAR